MRRTLRIRRLRRLGVIKRACDRVDAHPRGRVPVFLDPDEIIVTTEELRQLVVAVRAAIRVAYVTNLMTPAGLSAEGDLRAALKPFVDEGWKEKA